MYTILGPEFGPDEGNMVIIVRAIYGLKSAGASFRNHLANFMQFMGYNPSLDDPDLWIRPMKISSDDFEHYDYVLLYVDNVLSISDDPTEVLHNIDKYFGLKPGSLSKPNIYLCEKKKATRMENEVLAGSLSLSQYIQEVLKNTE